MIKKQIIGIIIAAIALVAVIVVYNTVFSPMIEERTAAQDDAPELLPGEEAGVANRFYMYSHLDREDMKSIEVENSYGSFRMLPDGNGSFYVDGYRGISLDPTAVSSLVTTCGSTLTKARVTKDASDEKLEEYGLKEPQAYWIVTDKDEKQYKVYVGRALLTGGGYYCRFAGRNSVYVLDTTLGNTVLQPVESFVTPYIIFGLSKNDYFTADDFTVMNKNEKVISVGKIPKEDQVNPNALAESVVKYPAPYVPDTETYYGILQGFTSFTGDSTYKLGTTEEDLKECGLDDPDFAVSFEYGGSHYYFLLKDDGEGEYFVVSGIYPDIITKIAKRNVPYLQYDLLKWLYPYVFRRDIKTISTIAIKTASHNEKFYISHFDEGDYGESIQVRSDNGLQLMTEDETYQFRQLYGELLNIAIKDYLPDEASEGVPMDEFVKDPENLTMRVEFETLSGEKLVYEYYRYSTRRCAISVNGRFDFCALNDDVKRIENDLEKILAGERIK